MATLPTADELRLLPLRAVVMYAARCARHVQRLFQLGSGREESRHRESIAKAISVSFQFASGNPIDQKMSLAAEDDAVAAVIFVREASEFRPALAFAANAAYAAISCANSAQTSQSSPSRATEGAKTTFAAATAGEAAFAADPLVRHAAVRDWQLLLKLTLGAFPDLGRPVVETANGAIGHAPNRPAPIPPGGSGINGPGSVVLRESHNVAIPTYEDNQANESPARSDSEYKSPWLEREPFSQEELPESQPPVNRQQPDFAQSPQPDIAARHQHGGITEPPRADAEPVGRPASTSGEMSAERDKLEKQLRRLRMEVAVLRAKRDELVADLESLYHQKNLHDRRVKPSGVHFS